ncbi:hypothetical protein SLEP1_g53543 [Rubroshorea leprosula]|uniref:Uncharacterized protein n=1 Tax=Rubroshorea leprosula TaxID=152421 RepID=A0AAV5MCI8_9ROSI|nr:hypothetical protein SLEP1_g53543 [Rubroshorea leprosula]
MASSSVDMKQPNMESDLGDASNIEPQEIADYPSPEDSETGQELSLFSYWLWI